jgi:DNA repair protein REV1
LNLKALISYTVIFHVDLDCFFVAVGRLSRPHLIDMPVVVSHSMGTGTRESKSDVSCASYEARAKGVKAGIWLEEAKRLCPEVQVIPYDFEEYKRVSQLFFETAARWDGVWSYLN